MQILVSPKDILPNPHRKLDVHKIDEEKIQTLTASMDSTGFWDNVEARKKGDKYELAYGHHRLIAFKRKYGDDAKLPLNVKDISDDQMLKKMIYENHPSWGKDALGEQEDLQAIVQAYADGVIDLPRPKVMDGRGRMDGVRNAPSFLPLTQENIVNRNNLTKPYTAETIALWLSEGKTGTAPWWHKDQVTPRIRNPLKLLQQLEEGLMTLNDVEGLTSDQAQETARGVAAIKASYDKAAKALGDSPQAEKVKSRGKEKAKKAAKDVTTKIKKAANKGVKYGTRDIREELEREKAEPVTTPEIPTIKRFAEKMSQKIYKFLGEEDKNWTKLNELVKYRDQLDEDSKKNLTVSLKRVAERCHAMIDAINGERPKLLA